MGAYEFSVGISVSPLSLPSGTVGSAYDQTITASGGTGPYSFSVTSGSLPSGLSLSNSGVISGTPDTPGTSNFGVTATDSNSDTGNRNYSIQINDVSACLFCDDFNDNIVAPNWLYLKGTWNETGGELVGSHTGKADAIATPAFVGCDLCTNNVTLQLGPEPDAKVSVLGWYQNSKTYVELMLVPGKDKLQLKQRVNNMIIAKGKGTFVLDPGVTYQVQIAFNGTDFVVSMNGNMLFSVPAAASPTGTVGFRVKKASAKFDQISLN